MVHAILESQSVLMGTPSVFYMLISIKKLETQSLTFRQRGPNLHSNEIQYETQILGTRFFFENQISYNTRKLICGYCNVMRF